MGFAETGRTRRPRGAELRQCLRENILVWGTEEERTHWRRLNQQIRRLHDSHPFAPSRVLVDSANNNTTTVYIAAVLASRRGCFPDHILREMADFWTTTRTPRKELPFTRFARAYFGGSTRTTANSLELSADRAGLPRRKAMALTLQAKGKSQRTIAKTIGVSQITVSRWMREFHKALKEQTCWCEHPLCSLNDSDRRKSLKLLQSHTDRSPLPNPKPPTLPNRSSYWTKELPNRSFLLKSSKPSELFSQFTVLLSEVIKNQRAARDFWVKHRPPRNEATGTPNLQRCCAYGVVPILTPNGGLTALEHRQIWRARNGPIPALHDIHHTDGDPNNNDPENLELTPRWVHRLMHGTHNYAL